MDARCPLLHKADITVGRWARSASDPFHIKDQQFRRAACHWHCCSRCAHPWAIGEKTSPANCSQLIALFGARLRRIVYVRLGFTATGAADLRGRTERSAAGTLADMRAYRPQSCRYAHICLARRVASPV